MTKFPRLEAMRRQRYHRELDLIEPLERALLQTDAALKSATYRANNLQRTIDTIQDAMGNKVMHHINEQMGYELAKALRIEIEKAVIAARPQTGFEDIYFKLSPMTLASLDPESLFSKIYQQYQALKPGRAMAPFTRFMKTPTGTVYRISVPSVHLESVIWNDTE